MLKDVCGALARAQQAISGQSASEGSFGFFARDAAGACPQGWLNPQIGP
jgi:hypothetical protein